MPIRRNRGAPPLRRAGSSSSSSSSSSGGSSGGGSARFIGKSSLGTPIYEVTLPSGQKKRIAKSTAEKAVEVVRRTSGGGGSAPVQPKQQTVKTAQTRISPSSTGFTGRTISLEATKTRRSLNPQLAGVSESEISLGSKSPVRIYRPPTERERKALSSQRSLGRKFAEGFKRGFQLQERRPIGTIETSSETKAKDIGFTAGAVSSIAAGSVVLPKVLQVADFAGDIVRAAPVFKQIGKAGLGGRLIQETTTRGGTAFVTFKAGEKTVDILAPTQTKDPTLTGLSEKQFKRVFKTAKEAETVAGFKPKAAETIPGKIGEGAKAFLKGSAGALLPAASPSKDVFRSTVKRQTTKLGLSPSQSLLVQERAEQRRRGLGVVQTIGVLQAESFANIVGGKEAAIAKQAGKFSTLGQRFIAKIVPGAVEGSISAGVGIGTGALQGSQDMPFIASPIKIKQRVPARSTLDDPSFKTIEQTITEQEFKKLGIEAGKPIPESALPTNVNKILTVVGKPQEKIITEQKGDATITTTITETPTRKVTLSRFYPEEPRKVVFQPSKVTTVLAGAGLGVVSAGLFGAAEGAAARSKFFPKAAKAGVATAGFTLDLPEAPGDFVTPILTSGASTRVKTVSPTTISSVIQPSKTKDVTPIKTRVSIKVSDVIKSFSTTKTKTKTADFTKTKDSVSDIQKTPSTSRNILKASKVPTVSTIPTRRVSGTPIRTPTPIRSITSTTQRDITTSQIKEIVKSPTEIINPVKSRDIINVNNVLSTQDIFTRTNVLAASQAIATTFTPKIPVPILGGGAERRGGRKRKGKRQFKYRSSLAARAYDIRGTKPKRLTGLEVRPILRGGF